MRVIHAAILLLVVVSLCSCNSSGESSIAEASAQEAVDNSELARRRDAVSIRCGFSNSGSTSRTERSPLATVCRVRLSFSQDAVAQRIAPFECTLRNNRGMCTVFEGTQAQLIEQFNATQSNSLPADAKLINVSSANIENFTSCAETDRPSTTVHKLALQVVHGEVHYTAHCGRNSGECTPGTSWQVECNTCHCRRNGTVECTQIGCNP